MGEENDVTTYQPTEPILVRWRMPARKIRDEERPESIKFEETGALAVLLINEVIFTNAPWHREDMPLDSDRKVALLHVNCNDVFAWGCADCETLPHAEIERLYALWEKETSWGAAVWCVIQRKEMPQRPVAVSMTAAGWDMDALQKEHGLRPNYYDGASRVLANHKYETFVAWCKKTARETLPFDKNWWSGWQEYTKAEPGWRTKEFEAEDDRRLKAFRVETGHDADA